MDYAKLLEKSFDWLRDLKEVGETFNIGAAIGTGNSSIVYKARDLEGASYAVKIYEESDDALPIIYREHCLLEKIGENERIVKYIGPYKNSGTVPRQIYFIFEYCEYGSIQNLLLKLKSCEKNLTEDVIGYILRSTMMALKDVHELNILHRDLKAANLLICKNGDIKLGDFDLAICLDESQSDTNKCRELVGSPFHIAPEVLGCERLKELSYDSRADVWSLGITAIELGDNSPPLSDVFPPRAIHQIIQYPPPTLKRPADWSQLYNDFVGECLEKTLDHRPFLIELLEHPFITNAKEDEPKIRSKLLKIINSNRNIIGAKIAPEITLKSESIKFAYNMPWVSVHHDDLATLYNINEESVITTLHQRFLQGNIYTYIGDILIIVNPFHDYPVYGSDISKQYRHRARCDNAPHIYGVGDNAYQDMMHHRQTQTIIFTGETCSGKSTARKHVIWHIANMSATNVKMVERIQKVLVIMDAFGNASTNYNKNSTRHIEYFELTFTKTGKMSGGIFWNYCLEKWRVTNSRFNKKQSNFHIFYYLLDALKATQSLELYSLEKGKSYNYLPESPHHIPSESVTKLKEVKDAFELIGFTHADSDTVTKILCSILQLGQIQFFTNTEYYYAVVENADIVEKIANLLEVDKKRLSWALTNFCLVKKGEVTRGRMSEKEAEETRDSLARGLYSRLVDWIVNLINAKLSLTRVVFGDQNSLGILDIPGFECQAKENTFDQFLVNVTNEQLQFLYNQRVFIWEMDDYASQEFEHATYKYHDNKKLLESILSKPNGLLNYLDTHTRTNGSSGVEILIDDEPDDTANTFINLMKEHNKCRSIKVIDYKTFSISHYSGQVKYDANNFIERNRNFLSPDIIEVLRHSHNSNIRSLFTNLMSKTGNITIRTVDGSATQDEQKLWTAAVSITHKKFNTTTRGKYSQTHQMLTNGTVMRNSLLEILQKVASGTAHFVRCLRSNLKSDPFSFDHKLIIFQIRAMHLVESVRARQIGYSKRLNFKDFINRYKFLAFDYDENVEETRENCRLLLIRLKLEGWALGRSKVMLKSYNEQYLARRYEDQVNKVVKIQSLMRAFIVRKKATIASRSPSIQGKSKGSGILKSPSSHFNIQNELSSQSKSFRDQIATPRQGPSPNNTVVLNRRNSSDETTVANDFYLENIERSPSPRAKDLVKSFEAVTSTPGSEKGLTGGCLPPLFKTKTKSPDSVTKNIPSSSSAYQYNYIEPKIVNKAQVNKKNGAETGPEVINPMVELTHIANKYINNANAMSNSEEPGPYNFQAMLKKTNRNLIGPEAKSLTTTSYQFSSNNSSGIITPRNSSRASPVSTSSFIRENGDNSEKNGKKIESLLLSPGIFIKGYCEDL